MCRPRRIDFQNGPDGMLLSHFTEDFVRILRDLGALENRYWRRRGSGKTTTRSQSDDATSKRKGGQGVMTAFPRLLSGCHWIPFWTCFW